MKKFLTLFLIWAIAGTVQANFLTDLISDDRTHTYGTVDDKVFIDVGVLQEYGCTEGYANVSKLEQTARIAYMKRVDTNSILSYEGDNIWAYNIPLNQEPGSYEILVKIKCGGQTFTPEKVYYDIQSMQQTDSVETEESIFEIIKGFIYGSVDVLKTIINFLKLFFIYLIDFILIFISGFVIILIGIQAIIGAYVFNSRESPTNIMINYMQVSSKFWWEFIKALITVIQFIWELTVTTIVRIVRG